MASSSASYDALGINWGPWRQLPNSQWYREGQDSSGIWYQEDQDTDPIQSPSTKELSLSFGSDSLPDISDPYQEDQDEVPEQPPSIKQSDQSLSSDSLGDVTWAKWTPLSNGQLQRVGRDLSGKWYKVLKDKDPSIQGQPHSTSESGQSSDLDRSTGETYLRDSGYGSVQSYAKSSRSFKGEVELHGKSSRASSPDATGKGRDVDLLPGVSLSSKRHSSDARESECDLPTVTDKEGESIQNFDFDRSTGETELRDSGHSLGKAYTKISRLSKNDNKGHGSLRSGGKISRSHGNGNGKGREIEQRMAIPSGSYTGGGAQDFAYGFLTATDKEGDSSSSSTVIPGLRYYAPAEEDERLDSVPELSRPLSYGQANPRTKMLSEGAPYNEDWSQYTVHRSKDFRFGTVFKVLWSEPMGNSRLSKHNKDPVGTGISVSEFGQRIIDGMLLYEGIRRFIVVDGNENGVRNGNSICLPIATYKKRGCTKPGVKPECHGVISTHDKEPWLLNTEPDLGVAPIRLMLNQDLQGIEKLAPESRINYSKLVTIEHNSCVHIIGKIHQEDLSILEAGVDTQWEKRVRDRKKDKKRTKMRDNEQISSRSKGKSYRSARIPRMLSEPHAPDGMREEGYLPAQGLAEHSGSTDRPIPSGPDENQEKGAKQSDRSSSLQDLGEKSTCIHEKPREPQKSGDSQDNTSNTQESRGELDSLTVSNNVIHNQSLHAEGTEVHFTGGTSLPNRPKSSGSSISLTESLSDTSATGQRLTTSQRRQVIIQRLIANVTILFQTRTQSRGENPRACLDSSSNQTHGGAISSETGNPATPPNSGIRQPNPPDKKRKLSEQSDEESSEEEEQASSQACKGKQKEIQVLFACPYVKRFSPNAHCKNNGWPSTSRVKAHLYQRHQQAIHCPRCHTIFDDQDALDTHIREFQCNPSDRARPGGFNKKQEKELRSRTGLSDLDECGKWEKIYMILFPDTMGQKIPSPYFDSNDFREPLMEFNAIQRRKLARLLTQHVTKKLKARHGESYESDLKEEFFEEAVDEAWRTCSSGASDKHCDGDGIDIASQNSAEQSSHRVSTSGAGPSCGTVPDDDTNEFFGAFLADENLWTDFLFDFNMPPNSDPHEQQDAIVNKHKADSGYSTKGSQGPQE